MKEDQSLLEGVYQEEIRANAMQMIFAFFIDFVIVIMGYIPFYLAGGASVMALAREIHPFMVLVVYILLIFFYRLICLLSLGRTLGMISSSLKYLNKHLVPLRWKDKFKAVLWPAAFGIRSYEA